MRSAFCMMVMANRGAPLDGGAPLGEQGCNATDANFDLSDFFLNSF
jgi:hypothetical protein